MKFWKRLLTLNILIMLLGTLIGCSKEEDKIPYPFEYVLQSLADETAIDEIIIQDETIEISENGFVTDYNLINSITKLEQYLEFVEEVEILGVRDQNLNKKQEQCKNWIKANGFKISERLLNLSIKSVACEAYSISGEYYRNCTIGPKDLIESNGKIGTIEIVDPILLTVNTYYVGEDIRKTLPLALETFYCLHEPNSDYDTATTNKLCKKSIDISKILISSTDFIEAGEIKTKSTFDKNKKINLENSYNNRF